MTSNLSPSCQRVLGGVCLVLWEWFLRWWIGALKLTYNPPTSTTSRSSIWLWKDYSTFSCCHAVTNLVFYFWPECTRMTKFRKYIWSVWQTVSGRHRCQSANWHLGSLKEGILWYYRTLPCMLSSARLRWFLLCLNMSRSGSRSGGVCPQ